MNHLPAQLLLQLRKAAAILLQVDQKAVERLRPTQLQALRQVMAAAATTRAGAHLEVPAVMEAVEMVVEAQEDLAVEVQMGDHPEAQVIQAVVVVDRLVVIPAADLQVNQEAAEVVMEAVVTQAEEVEVALLLVELESDNEDILVDGIEEAIPWSSTPASIFDKSSQILQ